MKNRLIRCLVFTFFIGMICVFMAFRTGIFNSVYADSQKQVSGKPSGNSLQNSDVISSSKTIVAPIFLDQDKIVDQEQANSAFVGSKSLILLDENDPAYKELVKSLLKDLKSGNDSIYSDQFLGGSKSRQIFPRIDTKKKPIKPTVSDNNYILRSSKFGPIISEEDYKKLAQRVVPSGNQSSNVKKQTKPNKNKIQKQSRKQKARSQQ